ncbi:transglutaminase family protein [Phenylobacterium sp.]|uniref:transglutaminase family protein n=1 Tax=Phenylobacterium sp. TaxID=1871053 RepID=UPI002DF5349E|nr:transglutaminase family protein [Phenylobacterium sp.]
MPVVSIRHLTAYRYRSPVAFGEHRMMLRPLEAHDQRLISAEVDVSPQPALHREICDLSGSSVGVVRFAGRSDRLVIESRVRVDHRPEDGFDLEGEDSAIGRGPFRYAPQDAAELARSLERVQPSEAVDAWAMSFLRPVGRTRLGRLLGDMSQAIHADFTYTTRLEGPPQTPQVTLETRRGSCRDFAVLMAEAARSLGLAAKFVSGYIYSSSPKSGPGHRGGGHTHAWVRVYLPGGGWTDFDPTNGLIGGRDLIRVAVVNDPRHALPLHGSWDGLAADFLGMDVEVEIEVEQASAQLPIPLRVARSA